MFYLHLFCVCLLFFICWEFWGPDTSGSSLFCFALVFCYCCVLSFPVLLYERTSVFNHLISASQKYPIAKTERKRLKKLKRYRCYATNSLTNKRRGHLSSLYADKNVIFIETKNAYAFKIQILLPKEVLVESGYKRLSKWDMFLDPTAYEEQEENGGYVIIKTNDENDPFGVWIPQATWKTIKTDHPGD